MDIFKNSHIWENFVNSYIFKGLITHLFGNGDTMTIKSTCNFKEILKLIEKY